MPDPVSRACRRPCRVDVEALHALVLQSLDDDQAVEVVSIPLAGKSSIADHMVIASGRSTRQVASMATKLAEKIKQEFSRIVRIEGLPTADWVLIDADDVIVHLFRPEVRTFYNLERMWAFGDEDAPSKPPRRPAPDQRRCCSTSSRAARSAARREAELVDRYLKRIAWPTKVTELPDRGGTLPAAAANAASPSCSTSAARRCRRWHSPRSSKAGATAASARRAS